MSRTAVLRTIAASIFLCMSSQVSAADPLLDVKLGDKGRLQARLVNEQGKALGKSPVRVLFRGKTIAKTQTDQRGFFTIRGLRGGAHIVECGGLVLGCRLWTAKAAPPNAQPQLLLVRDSRIIRAPDGISTIST